MPETIAVLGANGVAARHVLPRLAAAGYVVRALVRRPEAAGIGRACGAEIHIADIFDRASLEVALKGCSIGINLATSLPGPSGRGDYDANDRLRAEGTPNWVAACEASGVKRVIQQSIGMVNSAGSVWADEDTAHTVTGDSSAARAIAASLAMEQSVTRSSLDWIILRGGLYYGPGTGFDDGWHGRAAAGKLRLLVDGSDYVSLIHIADMAGATLAALQHWPSRQPLIICDDEPATWRDVFTFIAATHNQPPPLEGGAAGFPSFRLRNARAKKLLSWSPSYASWRAGLIR